MAQIGQFFLSMYSDLSSIKLLLIVLLILVLIIGFILIIMNIVLLVKKPKISNSQFDNAQQPANQRTNNSPYLAKSKQGRRIVLNTK